MKFEIEINDPVYTIAVLFGISRHSELGVGQRGEVESVAKQMQAQMPKPEPQGLGAVVEATRRGAPGYKKYVKVDNTSGGWYSADAEYYYNWNELQDITVLSEGVGDEG